MATQQCPIALINPLHNDDTNDSKCKTQAHRPTEENTSINEVRDKKNENALIEFINWIYQKSGCSFTLNVHYLSIF